VILNSYILHHGNQRQSIRHKKHVKTDFDWFESKGKISESLLLPLYVQLIPKNRRIGKGQWWANFRQNDLPVMIQSFDIVG
jgi:hypothetical protein